MSNEIKGVGDAARKLAELSSNASTGRLQAANTSQSTAAAPKADTVSISSTKTRIDAARQSLESEPVVDVEHVEKVRQKIAEGSYQIDNDRVAARFLEVESMIASTTGSARGPAGDG